MTTQTITFKNGTVLPVLAVFGSKDLIQGTYRECFEIRFPSKAVTYGELTALAVPGNLLELILTEKDSETNEVTAQYTHKNFTIVTGKGMKTDPEDGTPFYFYPRRRNRTRSLQSNSFSRTTRTYRRRSSSWRESSRERRHNTMAKIFYKQILSGKITIEDVPARWREQVEAMIDF